MSELTDPIPILPWALRMQFCTIREKGRELDHPDGEIEDDEKEEWSDSLTIPLSLSLL